MSLYYILILIRYVSYCVSNGLNASETAVGELNSLLIMSACATPPSFTGDRTRAMLMIAAVHVRSAGRFSPFRHTSVMGHFFVVRCVAAGCFRS